MTDRGPGPEDTPREGAPLEDASPGTPGQLEPDTVLADDELAADDLADAAPEGFDGGGEVADEVAGFDGLEQDAFDRGEPGAVEPAAVAAATVAATSTSTTRRPWSRQGRVPLEIDDPVSKWWVGIIVVVFVAIFGWALLFGQGGLLSGLLPAAESTPSPATTASPSPPASPVASGPATPVPATAGPSAPLATSSAPTGSEPPAPADTAAPAVSPAASQPAAAGASPASSPIATTTPAATQPTLRLSPSHFPTAPPLAVTPAPSSASPAPEASIGA